MGNLDTSVVRVPGDPGSRSGLTLFENRQQGPFTGELQWAWGPSYSGRLFWRWVSVTPGRCV